MKIKEALNLTSKAFSPLTPTPELEAELMLSLLLETTKTWLYSHPDKVLSVREISELQHFIKVRQKHIPLAHILKKKEFYGYEFIVDKSTLIPRPETELLVELALARISTSIANKPLEVLEIGVGSGAISISILASTSAKLNLTALDISASALKIAKLNRKQLLSPSKQKSLRLSQQSIFDARDLNKKYHLIISNPPYIPTSELSQLQPEVKKEPRLALDGGKDGLKFYRRLFELVKSNLSQDGYALFEIHSPKKSELLQLCQDLLGKNYTFHFHNDLTGRFRVLEIFHLLKD